MEGQMDASVKLGRIWGIPVGLHISWFLVFGLVTWSLASGYFLSEYPDLPKTAQWLLGGATSLMFFMSVLLHELGHSIVALRNKIPVRGITLFIFGGVAQIGKEPQTPGVEFRIAIAGPLTSLALAGLFGGLWLLDRAQPYLAAPSIWLARINLILGLFNLIPGFPLDGGRVLRAIIWKITANFYRATQIASYAGQAVAFGFIGLGLLTILRGNFFNGLWLAFIGWFLQNAAASSYAQVNLQRMLRDVTVAQVMSPECNQVPGNIPLDQLVEEKILTGGHRCFLVTEDGDRLRGMLTLRDVTAIPRANWSRVLAEQAMVPREKLILANPDMHILELLQTMDNAQVAQVPVVKADQIVGVISREHILHYIRILGEIGS
jgi:Zn-dependent protease